MASFILFPTVGIKTTFLHWDLETLERNHRLGYDKKAKPGSQLSTKTDL